jgi:hypothetical protein
MNAKKIENYIGLGVVKPIAFRNVVPLLFAADSNLWQKEMLITKRLK